MAAGEASPLRLPFTRISAPVLSNYSRAVQILGRPASDVDGEEFVELHNTGGSAVNLVGWCFNDGIQTCFDATHSVPAGAARKI